MVKIKVLVDNNTLIDQYYYGEPAVCYYLEDEDIKLLLDVGYSDIFIKNALLMKVDLDKVSTVVISHGHDDHTRGLKYFFKNRKNPITLIAHPYAFNKKKYEGLNIGAPYSERIIKEKCFLNLSKEPVQLSKHFTFLGEIPSYFSFEKRQSIGQIQINNQLEDDYLFDDSALAYQTTKGIYIITGCSHSGICNIIEHAKKVCKEDRILGLLGGLHLFEVNEQLEKTIDYFLENKITHLFPCHCVAFQVKARIHQSIPIHEVGVGLEIEW